jgi:hypothetical protein
MTIFLWSSICMCAPGPGGKWPYAGMITNFAPSMTCVLPSCWLKIPICYSRRKQRVNILKLGTKADHAL